MVAKSQHRIATKFIQDEIPAVLSDITLWVQSGVTSASAEQKKAICSALNALEAQLKRVYHSESKRQQKLADNF